MNIVTTIKKYFDKVGTVFYKWVDDRIWKERMEKALRDVDNKDMRVYLQACLTNQMHSQRMQNVVSSHNTSFNTRRAQNKQTDMMFDIATQALKKFWAVSAIVGVQPMSGPVSLVYRMVYKAIEDNQVRLEVCSAPVEAGTRRLQTRWSYEVMQNVQAVHSVDMEQDLKDMLSTMIADELIAEVVTDLHKVAKQGGNVSTLPAFDLLGLAANEVSVLDSTINSAANEIGCKTRRGVANFVIGSPLCITLLQATNANFVLDPSPGHRYTALSRVGTMNGTMTVYSSTAITDDSIIIGYKGATQVDCGYFICPYVPVMSSGVLMDENTFQPMVALMTRYGKFTFASDETTRVKSSDYYAVISFGEQEIVPEVDQTVVTQ